MSFDAIPVQPGTTVLFLRDDVPEHAAQKLRDYLAGRGNAPEFGEFFDEVAVAGWGYSWPVVYPIMIGRRKWPNFGFYRFRDNDGERLTDFDGVTISQDAALARALSPQGAR